MREQRTAGHRRSAWSTGRHRGVIAVPGADRLTWLHSLTTQHLTGAAADDRHRAAGALAARARRAPRGGRRRRHDHLARRRAGHGRALLDFLERMRFLMRVEPADVTADWAVLSLVGPGTDEALATLGVGPLGQPDVLAGAGREVRRRHRAAPGPTTRYARGAAARRAAGRAGCRTAPTCWCRAPRWPTSRRAGVPLAGLWAFEALRVAARRPRLGLRDRPPHPAGRGGLAGRRRAPGEGLLPGPGDGRPGAPPGPAAAQAGAAAPRRHHHRRAAGAGHAGHRSDGRTVGFVGTAVRHYELGPVALALVKQNVPDDAACGSASLAAIDPIRARTRGRIGPCEHAA